MKPPTPIELERLAVAFRCDYADLDHVDTYNLMERIGMLSSLKLFRSIPRRHRWHRRDFAVSIAGHIDEMAKVMARGYKLPRL